ncbi:hypothetical protein H4Q26_012613 [Puccinia striiformis f. sp. tritici PST-130]|nr:hypothetical protein H4Q26_012613 [Puccinia striiformis f. sp. tritici PST-130]
MITRDLTTEQSNRPEIDFIEMENPFNPMLMVELRFPGDLAGTNNDDFLLESLNIQLEQQGLLAKFDNFVTMQHIDSYFLQYGCPPINISLPPSTLISNASSAFKLQRTGISILEDGSHFPEEENLLSSRAQAVHLPGVLESLTDQPSKFLA